MKGALMLHKWLRGMGYEEGLAEFVKQFPEARYTGTIYRGMYFNHYPDVADIQESAFCSWTTDVKVAEYFASHTKYGFVLSKKSTGYDVHKIIDILIERGECPDNMKNYRKVASEKEIVDVLTLHNTRVRRVGLC